MNDTKTTRPTHDSPTSPAADAIEERVVAFAEQLGRLVGTLQARTDGWLDRQALTDQVTKIRDSAAGLLGHLGAGPASTGGKPRAARAGAKAKPVSKAASKKNAGRSGGRVDAPGKTHRKAPAPSRSVKHSDQAIVKMKTARQTRRTRRMSRS